MFNLKKMKKNGKKGFTLVELIVVLVILGILAAFLVPALLGYIDKARQKQYVEEAHSIYTAIQVVEDEQYAANKGPIGATNGITVATALTEVNSMVEPTVVTSMTITCKGDSGKDAYTVSELTLKFTSQNEKNVTITMDNKGSWGEAVEE